MSNKIKRTSSLEKVAQVAGAVLLMTSLFLLVGCQGVSNGSSNTTGSAQLAVSPATLNAGNVVVGASGTASGSLTASGGSVIVTAASSNNSQFTLSGLSLPVTIASGGSVPFTVTFNPSAAGVANATLTFTSNAQPSTSTGGATGTGTAAPAYSVNLSWNASSSSNVAGYNIYRAVYQSSCGVFSRVNSDLNTNTLYTDSTVADGTSYCYATTAVNSSNEESSYSNIVSAVEIPAP
jgi:Abnormal spindle-like microcephaly-assoc'd, ASPM-SPD-2-Hydin